MMASGMAVSEQALLWAATGFAACYFLFLHKPRSYLRTVLKTLPVALLAVFVWFAGGPVLLVLALGLSALGDALLSRPGERAFLNGLVAFLLAHVAYGVLFIRLGDPTFLAGEPWRLAAALAAIVAVVIVFLSLRRAAGALAPAVAIYTFAIISMAVLSLTVPPFMVFVGAALFMSSDAALAVSTFALPAAHRMQARLGIYVWASYFLAQVILVLSLLPL